MIKTIYDTAIMIAGLKKAHSAPQRANTLNNQNKRISIDEDQNKIRNSYTSGQFKAKDFSKEDNQNVEDKLRADKINVIVEEDEEQPTGRSNAKFLGDLKNDFEGGDND